MARFLLHPVGHELSEVLGPDEADKNRAAVARLEARVDEALAVARAGWGPKYAERVREKGKLTSADRIARLKDPGTEAFEVGSLVNFGRKFTGSKLDAPGAGVVTALVKVQGRWTVVISNDNTVASGAWWPLTPEKIERAQEIALRLRLPVVYLVDCSGLFLPEQSRSFGGGTGAGHIFKQNARLADAGVPQIAGVFGDCIAGGGYMPIISDRVVMTESAYMVIAGAALVRGAKSLKLTSLDIGGPEIHVNQSVVADVRVPDDETALDAIRAELAKLPGSAAEFYRGGEEAAPPAHDPAELSAIFPSDFRQGYDVLEVIARLVDRSLFHEVLGDVGREMVTGIARIGGLWVGILTNRQGLVDEPGVGKRPGGALYREGIAKISAFSRSCNDDGVPIVWLQDISGFDIGVQAERLGLLGYGSNLIYTNSTNTVPMFTVLLRKASGAGYYAMAGMPYDPVLQLSTPLTRLAVMEGRTLAIATYNSKLDDDFEIASEDPGERAEIERGMADVAARIDADMDPVAAAARMDTDEIVPLAALRDWLVVLTEAAWQANGYRRTKNPRIWSLHDLEALRPPSASGRALAAIRTGETIAAPSVGTWTPEIAVGAVVSPGQRLGRLVRADRADAITAPEGPLGAAAEIRPAGPVSFGERLVQLGAVGVLAEASGEGTGPEADVDGVPVRADTDGTIWLAPEPGAAPFAAVGARVAAHATLALVEVMKTYTPVRAPIAGEVVSVRAVTGRSVAAGEVLFTIRAG